MKLKMQIELELTRVEGMNASKSDVLEALIDDGEGALSAYNLFVECMNGDAESEYEIASVELAKLPDWEEIAHDQLSEIEALKNRIATLQRVVGKLAS